MPNIWFTSDQHFGHANILNFKDKQGNPIRPEFSSVEEMDEAMVSAWNSVISPGDTVYHLGDLCFKNYSAKTLLGRLHGAKCLIVGNHDNIKLLTPWVQQISMWKVFKEQGFICTHLPIRETSFVWKVPVNVHGHTHQHNVDSIRYFNVSVEQNNYLPFHLDEIIKYIKDNDLHVVNSSVKI